MSSDNVMSHVNGTDDLMVWAKGLLDTYATWNTYIFDGTDQNQLYNFITKAQPPMAIITYTGSNWQNQPLRKATFGVFVAQRYYDTLSTSVTRTRDLMDKAIELLDHTTLNEGLCRVIRDVPVNIENSGMTCILVTFQVDDH